MDFVIALLALLALGLALWAVVEARRGRPRVEVLLDTHEAVIMLHEVRLSALEARCERIEKRSDEQQLRLGGAIDELVDPAAWAHWKCSHPTPAVDALAPILRTPTGERPEVRHVETDEAGH